MPFPDAFERYRRECCTELSKFCCSFTNVHFLTVASEIQRKVLFGDEDSYLVGAMDPIYAAVRQLKGQLLLNLNRTDVLTMIQEESIKLSQSHRVDGLHTASWCSNPR